jgi:Pectinacetylesterase
LVLHNFAGADNQLFKLVQAGTIMVFLSYREKNMYRFLVLLMCVTIFSAFQVACVPDKKLGVTDDDNGLDNDDDDDDIYGDPSTLPTLPDLEADTWNVFRPGGETTCSYETEFEYYVYPGTVNKVVVEFMGGGACWTNISCTLGSGQLFNDEIVQEDLMRHAEEGIHDHSNPDNPFRDWYMVFIPYCTGDIHWGDAVGEYGDEGHEIELHHKGAVNARAVLAWIYENFSDPETIFVTGCSAGSYGSLGWTPYLMQHYPDSQVIQFGDSGAGVITDSFFNDSFPVWNAYDALPNWIDDIDEANWPDNVDLAYMYNTLAAFYPNMILSQYNTAYDNNQVFFYEAMGGGDNIDTWSATMRDSISSIEAASPNFRYYTMSGEKHCITPYDEFYTYEVDGVKLVDWVNDLANGVDVDNIDCGENCDRPE